MTFHGYLATLEQPSRTTLITSFFSLAPWLLGIDRRSPVVCIIFLFTFLKADLSHAHSRCLFLMHEKDFETMWTSREVMFSTTSWPPNRAPPLPHRGSPHSGNNFYNYSMTLNLFRNGAAVTSCFTLHRPRPRSREVTSSITSATIPRVKRRVPLTSTHVRR